MNLDLHSCRPESDKHELVVQICFGYFSELFQLGGNCPDSKLAIRRFVAQGYQQTHITKTELGKKLAMLRAPASLKPVCHELRKTMLRPYTTHVQEHLFNKGEEGAERHFETYSGLP